MSSPDIESILPAPLMAPCGDPILRAKAAPEAAARSLWKYLATVGENRARREMRLVACHTAITRPALAASLRAAARQRWAQ